MTQKTVFTEDDPQPHSLWLVPAKPACAALQTTIRDIATIQGSPPFLPHVTLLGDLTGAPSASLRACRTCIGPSGRLTTRVTSVSRGTAFFMSLFLDVDILPDILEARQRLCQSLVVAPPQFRPHISLAYGLSQTQISANRLKRLEVEFARSEILLDRVAVVSSAQSIPISSWRILHEFPLLREDRD